MTPPVLFVAIWKLSNGKIVPTLTTEATYRRWSLNPSAYAERRIRRWNSPNRRDSKLERAVAFKVEEYVHRPFYSGVVRAVGGR